MSAQANLEHLQAEIAATSIKSPVGRVSEIGRGTIQVTGLSLVASLGDLVSLEFRGGGQMDGEIIQVMRDQVQVLANGPAEGLSIGDRVIHIGQNTVSPDETWIGRIIDPFGNALDNAPLLRGRKPRALRQTPLNPTQRRRLGGRLETGLSVFNTMLPIVRGQRIGLFAGSGVGKSTLLAMLSQGLAADVVVIAMIGERGREVREFVERVLGKEGLARSVIIAATSEQSPLVRRRCAWMAAAVAEHFRDQGLHVLLLADSITRFADAHREVALSAGEAGSLRGYPPSTAHLITALCERAGPGIDGSGDITAVFTVLVAGSDMEEPIADILRGVLDGHIVLDRTIAERGRFPAIDILRSVSRALPEAASPAENAIIAKARRLMGTYDRSEMMIQAGLYQKGTDQEIDRAIEAWPKLDAFIGRVEHQDSQASFDALQACLGSEQTN